MNAYLPNMSGITAEFADCKYYNCTSIQRYNKYVRCNNDAVKQHYLIFRHSSSVWSIETPLTTTDSTLSPFNIWSNKEDTVSELNENAQSPH